MEPKKLSEQELAAIWSRLHKAIQSAGRSWRRVRPLIGQHWNLGTIQNHTARPIDSEEAWDLIEAVPIDMPALHDHIAALEAEQKAALDRVIPGHEVSRVIQEQAARIETLENIMTRVAALGVKGVDENLGVAAGRMTYMRESLTAALKGDLSLLEAAEQMFNKASNSNGRD